MSSVQLFHSALDLQQQRCKLFHDWSESLQSVALDQCTLEEIHKLINTELIPQFQHISKSMRALQQKTNCLVQTSNEHFSKNKQHHKQDDQQVRLLSNWIDEIQCAEQEHYAISVELNMTVLEHLQLNATCGSSGENVKIINCTNSVHVQNVCALNKIFAPRVLEHLQFIRCNSVDDWEESKDDFSESDNNNDVNKDKQHHNALRKELCSKFASTVEPLLQRQRESQAKIVELVDTLQNEVSDLESLPPVEMTQNNIRFVL